MCSRGGVCAVPLSGALSSLNGQTLDGYQAGVLAADAAGNLYYPTDDGISRASAGGNLREVVLESGQYSFGDPMNGLVVSRYVLRKISQCSIIKQHFFFLISCKHAKLLQPKTFLQSPV